MNDPAKNSVQEMSAKYKLDEKDVGKLKNWKLTSDQAKSVQLKVSQENGCSKICVWIIKMQNSHWFWTVNGIEKKKKNIFFSANLLEYFRVYKVVVPERGDDDAGIDKAPLPVIQQTSKWNKMKIRVLGTKLSFNCWIT